MNAWTKTLRGIGVASCVFGALAGPPAFAQEEAGAPDAPATPAPEGAPVETPPAPAEAPAPVEAPAAPVEAAPVEPVDAVPAPTTSIPTVSVPTASVPAPPASPEASPEGADGPAPVEPATAAPPRIVVALPPPPSLADDLPIPTLTIDRIPPSTSFEFAIQVSYGTVAYFRDQVPPWVGFGFRGGWGKNFGLHRLGVSGTLSAEGDIGVHTQLALEPLLAWDYVSRGGVLLGAGVGPAAVYTSRNSTVDTEIGFYVAPVAAARVGWSQTWSRVGRRLFLFVEPKVRMAEGRLSPVVAVAVGSGAGR